MRWFGSDMEAPVTVGRYGAEFFDHRRNRDGDSHCVRKTTRLAISAVPRTPSRYGRTFEPLEGTEAAAAGAIWAHPRLPSRRSES